MILRESHPFSSFVIYSVTYACNEIKTSFIILGEYWKACVCMCLVAQLCPTLCDPMDCSPPASSVHGILQARILEWVAMPSSKVSSQPRDRTQVSHIAGRFSTSWTTREAHEYWSGQPIPSPTQKSNLGLLHCRWTLPTELSGKPLEAEYYTNTFKIILEYT